MGRRKVNPARAGMILNAKTQDARLIRKPRASGDDPFIKRRYRSGIV